MVGMDIVESRLSGPPSPDGGLRPIQHHLAAIRRPPGGGDCRPFARAFRPGDGFRARGRHTGRARDVASELFDRERRKRSESPRPRPRGAIQDEWLEWDSIIEVSSRMLLEALEAGSPPERLTHTEHTRPEHLLHPLVLAGLPTLLYSPGGQGKSWVAMFVAILLENGINFEGGTGRQASTLYLDWEVTRQEAGGEQRLSPAPRRPDIRFPLYRRCVRPLADETSELAKMVAEHDIRTCDPRLGGTGLW